MRFFVDEISRGGCINETGMRNRTREQCTFLDVVKV